MALGSWNALGANQTDRRETSAHPAVALAGPIVNLPDHPLRQHCDRMLAAGIKPNLAKPIRAWGLVVATVRLSRLFAQSSTAQMSEDASPQ
jgi:hypothetical protein